MDEVTRMLDIESVNMDFPRCARHSRPMSLHKLTRHRGAFPNDDALIKLIYLALWNISKR